MLRNFDSTSGRASMPTTAISAAMTTYGPSVGSRR